jgi:hypothetical protein
VLPVQHLEKQFFKSSVVDPVSLNPDPDPAFQVNQDSDPVPDPDLGFITKY